MVIYLRILIFILLASCGYSKNNPDNRAVLTSDTVTKSNEIASSQSSYIVTDKTITFLSRDTNGTMIINEAFCKTITAPEKAALGYVATFIGNECNWHGDYKDDRSNLKCKILSALDLGYQCSDKHLGFLRKMFKNDAKVLEDLKSDNCPTTPDGATIQDTFEEIRLTVKGNEILVFFKASGINMREGISWSWTETDHFQFETDHIRLIKKDKSKVKREKFVD